MIVAGLMGQARQSLLCDTVRNAAMARMEAAGTPQATQHSMQRALYTANISATALNVLKTPELLYLPRSFRARLASSGHAAARNRRELEAHLVRVMFVNSTLIGITYHNVWDTDKLHQQQVRPTACLNQESCVSVQRRLWVSASIRQSGMI